MVKIFSLFMIEMKTALRYKLEVITSLIGLFSFSIPAFAIIFFGDISGSVIPNGDRGTYLIFLLISTAYWGFIENFWDTIFDLRRKMREGILETTMVMPLENYDFLIGWSLKGIFTTVINIFPLLIFAFIYYAYKLSITNILLILSIFLISIIANYGLSLILVGIGMIWTEADQVVSLIANIAPFVCGLYFPISMLPKVFLPLTLIFPFSWALDIMRNIIFGTTLLLPINIEIALFIIISVVYIIVGNLVYTKFINIAKKNGLSKF